MTAIQSTTNLGMLLGPAVSGVAIAHVGVQNVLFLDAATFLVSTLCLIPIRMRHAVAPGPPQVAGTFLAEILTGFRFIVVHQRSVRRPMLTSTFFSLGMSAFVFLLPIVADDLLRAGPVQLGWLWSALGAGTLVASAVLSLVNQGDLRYRLWIVAAALAVGGLATCALPSLDTPVLAGALIAAIGGSTALFTPIVWALLQELTPAHLLDRVFTAFSTGGMASAMVGRAHYALAGIGADGPTLCCRVARITSLPARASSSAVCHQLLLLTTAGMR